MLVQPDGALVRAESVLRDGQDEVGLVVIDLLAVASLSGLDLVVPQDQHPSGGVGQVTAADKVVLVRHTLLALRALTLAHVVHD